MKETKIEKNHEYFLEKLREHSGWAEIKIKNGYIIEANLKITLNRNK